MAFPPLLTCILPTSTLSLSPHEHFLILHIACLRYRSPFHCLCQHFALCHSDSASNSLLSFISSQLHSNHDLVCSACCRFWMFTRASLTLWFPRCRLYVLILVSCQIQNFCHGRPMSRHSNVCPQLQVDIYPCCLPSG